MSIVFMRERELKEVLLFSTRRGKLVWVGVEENTSLRADIVNSFIAAGFIFIFVFSVCMVTSTPQTLHHVCQ